MRVIVAKKEIYVSENMAITSSSNDTKHKVWKNFKKQFAF